MNEKKKIVILGAGFGGLRAAILISKKLRRWNLLDRYQTVLLDRNEHHTYTPLLYEVATTSKETANITCLHQLATYPIRDLIRRRPITFLKEEVLAIDLIEKRVCLRNGEDLFWETLVLALGSETNYFGIPGLSAEALTLKTFADAIRIRDAVWNRAMETKGIIRIAIGGGGSTGVELAGELKAWCGELEREFRQCRLDVTIIETAPAILPGLNPGIVLRAKRRLKRLGVILLESEQVERVDLKTIILASGRKVDFDLLVWTGGVKAPSVLSYLPLKTEDRGKIAVVGQMECLPQTKDLKLHSRVYALGDSVCFYDPVTQKPVAGVARAALSQSRIVAHNLIEEIKQLEVSAGGGSASGGKSYKLKAKSYIPREYPYIIPIGGKYALAKLGPIIIEGFFGWILKGLVELNYLFSIMPFWRAVRIWLKGLRIFIQNDRLG